MNSRAKAAPDDWRRTGQEQFLLRAQLKRGPWRQYRPGWDHDHCEFCFATFSAVDGDLKSGYTTLDEYRWICESCFEDFREEFGFVVRGDTG